MRSTIVAFRRSYRPPRRTPPVMFGWPVVPVLSRRLMSAASNFCVLGGDCAKTAPDRLTEPTTAKAVRTRLITRTSINTRSGYRDDELDEQKVQSDGPRDSGLVY